MNLLPAAREPRIPVAEPADSRAPAAPAPEGNAKIRNYRHLNENIRAYSPTGDINTSPEKGKLVAKFDVCSTISPPRAKILELLRPEDPGRDALEAIVRPAPRRGLTRPLDEDTRRFLQRALMSPSPQSLSPANSIASSVNSIGSSVNSTNSSEFSVDSGNDSPKQRPSAILLRDRSLADELKEAEESSCTGGRGLLQELRVHDGATDDVGLGIAALRGEAVERERLARLALAVEEDEETGDGLSAAARRLDALLAESRELREELAGIQQDMQAQVVRAGRCAAAARALDAESRALRYLDDVVALLRGDVAAAVRARSWPFALPTRQPGRNYIV